MDIMKAGWSYGHREFYPCLLTGDDHYATKLPGLWLTANATAHLRELLGIPDLTPEEMDYPCMHSELYRMGWRQLYGIEGYAHRQHGCIWNEEWRNGDYGVRDAFMRRALRRARELDQT